MSKKKERLPKQTFFIIDGNRFELLDPDLTAVGRPPKKPLNPLQEASKNVRKDANELYPSS